jgi:two-component system NarL family sensor kinase
MYQIDENIKFLLVVGIAAMLLLFTSFLLIFILIQRKKYEYQKNLQTLNEIQKNQLIEAAVLSEEKERHRIAEELHDEVGAILSSAKLHFEGIIIDNTGSNNKLYEKGYELLKEAIHKVRGISHSLHSNVLKEFGLNQAIQQFISKIADDTVIKATTDLDKNYTTIPIESVMSVYRIVQELTNNILKHANAKTLHITSVSKADFLKLTIIHDGNGLTQQRFEEVQYQKEGLGLKNIQNRIILLKGNLLFSCMEDRYYIDIYIPVGPKYS